MFGVRIVQFRCLVALHRSVVFNVGHFYCRVWVYNAIERTTTLSTYSETVSIIDSTCLRASSRLVRSDINVRSLSFDCANKSTGRICLKNILIR